MDIIKPRVIKDYDKLDERIQEQIKLVYPHGFSKNLIKFTNKEGIKVSALPFETDEKYYLIRMTVTKAKEIILKDDDYNVLGHLKDNAKDTYSDKYSDLDYLDDYIDNDDDDD